jgi:hypothetical protein
MVVPNGGNRMALFIALTDVAVFASRVNTWRIDG